MKLLIDIGNTHVHVGVADGQRIARCREFSTGKLTIAELIAGLKSAGEGRPKGAVLCSVVPEQTPSIQVALKQAFGFFATELTHESLKGVGVNYPRPDTIGPDRLANAIAARRHFGAPSVVVDFGTAVTFDVIDGHGDYAGGIIAPGLAAMTDYLHEKTALLPRIEIEETRSVIGKSTREAMLIGAVNGYRGLVRELLRGLAEELKTPSLPVVATGGYAELIARGVDAIGVVDPNLTLEGLRLFAEEIESETK